MSGTSSVAQPRTEPDWQSLTFACRRLQQRQRQQPSPLPGSRARAPGNKAASRQWSPRAMIFRLAKLVNPLVAIMRPAFPLDVINPTRLLHFRPLLPAPFNVRAECSGAH
jgi:hypothetical protein